MHCEKLSLSQREAKAALKEIKKHRQAWRREVRSYYCAACNAWHLTSKEDKFFEPIEGGLNFTIRWLRLLHVAA